LLVSALDALAMALRGNFRTIEQGLLPVLCMITRMGEAREISDRLPGVYFPEVEAAHPGALASQWIPSDPELWRLEHFREFLEARKVLLANEVNRHMEDLLHGDMRWLAGPTTWPNGIQEELSQPVAVLRNGGGETIGIASQAGFRCFTAKTGARAPLGAPSYLLIFLTFRNQLNSVKIGSKHPLQVGHLKQSDSII